MTNTCVGKFRRLPLLAALSVCLMPPVVTYAADAPVRRPNLLFIITDDQRWDALGVVQHEQGDQARWPWFKTPNMDRLATEGVRFRNAFVVHSLCSPSRASFLTGLYGHRNGIVDNSTQLSSNVVNQAQLLRNAGYQTAYVGKFHMAFQKDRPGFDHIASYTSQGEYYGSTFLVDGVPHRATNWVDDVATDYALDFIRTNQDCPWFMVLGFKTPHTPRQPPERARNRFTGEEVKPALNASALPSYGKGQRAFKGEEIGKPVETDADSHGNDPYLLNYFRAISAVDDDVGHVLDELDKLNLAQDTAVVFVGDNGYYLGEHGLGDKRSAYDEAMRIPLLLRYPRMVKAGQVIDEMALNIDLAPTFLQFAHVPVPPVMQGASWIPLLEGRAAGWRQSFLYEYFFEPGLPATPPMLAVRTPSAKLIQYPGHSDWTEMFDLVTDPYETNNLARDPAHNEMLLKLQNELNAQKSRVGDPFAEVKR